MTRFDRVDVATLVAGTAFSGVLALLWFTLLTPALALLVTLVTSSLLGLAVRARRYRRHDPMRNDR